jgi:hypothetical protein
MNSKEKEVLLKLIRVAENQQKALEKLAQSYTPEQEKSIYDNFDPLSKGNMQESSPEEAAKHVKQNFPWLEQKPQAPQKPTPQVRGANLPEELKHAIDSGAPGLKGSLMMQVHGGNVVDVQYNASRVQGGTEAVKTMLQKAFGTSYVVGNVLAVNQPDLKNWSLSGNYY